jgi:hypothetical protein
MSMKRILCAVAAAAALLVAGPLAGSASAAKKYCVSNNHGSKACFEPHGDTFYVKDTDKDGEAAAVYFKTSYGRTGECRNVEGNGVTIFCNLDLREGARVQFWAVNIEDTTTNDHYRFWSTDRQTII